MPNWDCATDRFSCNVQCLTILRVFSNKYAHVPFYTSLLTKTKCVCVCNVHYQSLGSIVFSQVSDTPGEACPDLLFLQRHLPIMVRALGWKWRRRPWTKWGCNQRWIRTRMGMLHQPKRNVDRHLPIKNPVYNSEGISGHLQSGKQTGWINHSK